MIDQLNLFAKKENGKLQLNNKEALNQWIKKLPDGEDIAIRFVAQKDFKSTRQLRLLYKEFREIAKFTGSSVEDVKLDMKYHFGLCYTHTIENKNITICKSISDLKKSEISELIESVDIWANQNLGLQLLTFDDKTFLNETKFIFSEKRNENKTKT